MISQIFWIEPFTHFRLGTMARPRGGDWLEDEIRGWKSGGIDVVVSALTDLEMTELDIVEEATLCATHGVQFFRFPIQDRCTPTSQKEWGTFIESVIASLGKGTSCVTHCRMGIGRASMMAVSIMLHHGVMFDDAFQWMAQARGLSVPDTDEQRYWVLNYANSLTKK